MLIASRGFEREARILAALNHPHIAQMFGLVASGGGCAIVMELVDGRDLADRLARGPVLATAAFQIGCQIAAAREAAHERQIIHRELKPTNVKTRDEGW